MTTEPTDSPSEDDRRRGLTSSWVLTIRDLVATENRAKAAEARVAELEATLKRARDLAEEWYNLADSLALHAVLDGPQDPEADDA